MPPRRHRSIFQELCVPLDSVQGRPQLRSAATGCIQLPIGQRSFAFSEPSVWNSLPPALHYYSLSWTLSNRSWKLTIQTVTNITWCFFCNYSHRDISVAFEVSNNKYFIVGLQARMVHGCRLLSEKFGLFYLVTVGLILSKL